MGWGEPTNTFYMKVKFKKQRKALLTIALSAFVAFAFAGAMDGLGMSHTIQSDAPAAQMSYTAGTQFASSNVSADKPYIDNGYWRCYYGDYEKDVKFNIAIVTGNQQVDSPSRFQLGLFVDGVCRGIATSFSWVGDYAVYSLRAWTNDDLYGAELKLVDKGTGDIYDLDLPAYEESDMVGTIDNPLLVQMSSNFNKPYIGNAVWKCYYGNYENCKTAYVGITSPMEYRIADLSEYQLGAFVGNECRGVASCLYGPDEHDQYQIRIWYNDILENVSFKLYNQRTGDIHDCKSGSIDYGTDMIGNVDSPILFSSNAFEANDSIFTHKVIYMVDGEEFATENAVFGTTIKLVNAPVKDGFTFSGWKSEYTIMPDTDIVVTGAFKRNSYTITFVANGDSVSDKLEYGATISAPANPTKIGYTFTSWNPTVPETVPARNMTFTAQYRVNSHFVTFIGADNEPILETEVNYGEVIPTIEAPEIEGCTFIKWTPALSPGETMPDSSLTYTAVYGTNSHAIKYMVDGEFYYSTAAAYGDEIVTIPAPTKEGCTFSGWKNEHATMPDSDIEITGSFTKNKYAIAFYADDNVVQDTTIYYGDTIKVPVVSKEGYTFIGWDKPVAQVMPAAELKYTAQFIVNTYNLNYCIIDGNDTIPYRSFKYASGEVISDELPDLVLVGYDCSPWQRTTETVMKNDDIYVYCSRTAHNHSVTFVVDGEAIQTTTQNYGTAILTPEDPEKEGYDFTGWTPFVPAVVPDVDVEYVAQFTPKSFRINFLQANGKLIESKEYEYGTEVVAPVDSVAKLDGYHFTKWEPEFNAVVTGEATYSAVYEINRYKVSFLDADDDLLISYNMNYGSVITVQPNAPEVAGQTFAGWEPEFIPGVTFVPAEDMVFKAIYKSNPHTVSYVIDGKIYFKRVLAEGDAITAIPEPAKEGYTFAGWENIPEAMPGDDIVIYGKFTPNIHKVTFIYGEGEDERIVKEVAYGKPVVAPTPQKTGYTFVAWNLIVEATMPDYDLEYTAVFAKNKYSVVFYDYDGATVLRKQTLAYGDEIEAPETPTRKGYEFRKWNLEVAKTMPARNLTYVATYSVNLYNFTYMVDDEVYMTKEYVYGRDLVLIPELTKKGCDFSGWIYENPVDGESHNIPEIMPDHDVVISGSFTRKNTFVYENMLYSIVDYENRRAELVGFDDAASYSRSRVGRAAEGGESVVVPSKVYDENTNDSCTVFSIAAKAFENVNVESVTIPETVEKIEPSALNNENLKAITFEGDKIPELKANAIPETVNITLTNVEDEEAEKLIEEAKDALKTVNEEALAVETKAAETDKDKVSEEFTVTASANIAGVVIEGVGTYKYGDVIALSAAPLEGYDMEWHVGDNIANGDTYVCSEAQNLKAKLVYKAITYDVIYKIEGVEVERKSCKYNASLADLEAPKAADKEGYTFQNWSALPDYMPAHEVVVVGSYKINTYTVSFKLNDQIVATKDYTYGATIATPEIEKTGYHVEWDNALENVPANDLTINGDYVANVYTITYMYKDEVVNTQEVAYNSDIVDYVYTPANTDEFTYTFVHWKDAEGLEFDLKTMTIAKDITLTAVVDVVTGIYGINASDSDLVDVYTLNGVKVAAQVPVSVLESNLQPGIYIINGVKVQITK